MSPAHISGRKTSDGKEGFYDSALLRNNSLVLQIVNLAVLGVTSHEGKKGSVARLCCALLLVPSSKYLVFLNMTEWVIFKKKIPSKMEVASPL